MDSNNNCFICADDCSNSCFFLINLTTKKYKTKYTSLIGELINPEYELRVTSENKICERCSIICEKYDELQQETKTVRSVLARQIAHTYSIDTNQTMVYMDKSKIFVDLQPNALSVQYYQCKLCPRFITPSIDTVNSHILYHKIVQEDQMQTNEILKELTPAQKRNPPVRRDSHRKSEPVKSITQQKVTQFKFTSQIEKIQEIKKNFELELPQFKNELATINIQVQQEYDEDTLESLIDLDLLDDPMFNSNLKNHKCMITGCQHKFSYICDYVRHLKFKHKSTLNHIFAVVRANIKRPNKVDKLMCPYCFTKTSSNDSLEHHVRQHEEAAKSNLFTDRINEFVNNVMSSSRCETCDNEIIDPTVLECSHEIAKSGMATKMSCIYCSRDFYSEKLYNNHLALDHDHCFICGLTCEDKIVLSDHIRSHLIHTEYSCTFCNDIYQTKFDLLDHIKLKHIEQYCLYCQEWFVEKDDLEFHVRYAHADKRMLEKPCICDTCGASFKNKTLFTQHQRLEHQKRKIYTCSGCKESFRYRYVLMEHISTVHKRTIVDNETNFYKCFVCMRGFSSQNRKTFIQHVNDHKASTCFCSDCNVNLETVHHLEAHRERSHQDFSILVEKKPYRQNKTAQTITKEAPNPDYNSATKPATAKILSTPAKRKQPVIVRNETVSSAVTENLLQPLEQIQVTGEQFTGLEDSQQQQIIVQTEDGNLLNMNNFILTENGELIIQNLDGLLPNGEETDDGTGEQIHISNLEQFLIEQGLSSSTEISYIHPDNSQIIIQNDDGTVSQSSQESLLQTYKEIFEPDEDIPTELIAPNEVHAESTSQSLILNGDYMVQSTSLLGNNNNNGQVIEQVEVQSTTQVDANQSTLDELGDILLEVAAAAEKEKKPKVIEQKIIRETLWGTRKRNLEPINNGSSKKRSTGGRHSEPFVQETEQPASNFSQAYEFFVKGFNDKKQKHL